jgi:hypothetical protein
LPTFSVNVHTPRSTTAISVDLVEDEGDPVAVIEAAVKPGGGYSGRQVGCNVCFAAVDLGLARPVTVDRLGERSLPVGERQPRGPTPARIRLSSSRWRSRGLRRFARRDGE